MSSPAPRRDRARTGVDRLTSNAVRRGMAALVRCAVDGTVRVLAVGTLLQITVEIVGDTAPVRGWIGLGVLPAVLERALLAGFAAGVCGWRWLPGAARAAVRAAGAVLAAVCASQAAQFWWWCAAGHLASGFPIPAGAWCALALGCWAWRPWGGTQPARGGVWVVVRLGRDAVIAAAGLAAFAIGFGSTDYARPADAIVVFGAGVKGDGTPSPSLRERVERACALYRDGLAPVILCSGGVSQQVPVSEAESMQRHAQTRGVPAAALLGDETGVNTLATMRTVVRLAHQRGWRSVLLVSHSYHLPRIKLFSRRLSIRAYTVPCATTRRFGILARAWLRDLGALLFYYFSPHLTAVPAATDPQPSAVGG